jgi:UDP-glucose 4-epimerase
VTEHLIEEGHTIVALDNLQHGHRAAVHPGAIFIEGDLLDESSLRSALLQHHVDAVVHLAAEALIDESLRDPGRFFRANVSGGLNLLEAMVATKVDRLVFSSTAAVYGAPQVPAITEESSTLPVNSYGESKLAFERMLAWYGLAHRLKYVCLRYFNAAGATDCFGEWHVPETHLIPLLLEVALGQRSHVQLYGFDYDTPDGTCVRDYIHVSDIAQAHALALVQIERVAGRSFNLGNGEGYSNLQVIEAVSRVTGRRIPVIPAPRRLGDPTRLVANAERIRRELGWRPRVPEIHQIIEAAWRWRLRHTSEYNQ